MASYSQLNEYRQGVVSIWDKYMNAAATEQSLQEQSLQEQSLQEQSLQEQSLQEQSPTRNEIGKFDD